MLVDTHTHLYLEEFLPNHTEAVDRAITAGVERMIFPNVDVSTIQPMKALHAAYPQNTAIAMGLHPTSVDADWKKNLNIVKSEIDNAADGELVAIGEIGIDLYWDKTYLVEQMEVFATQCDWAVRKDLPIIIHCRDGLDEVLEVFDNMSVKPRGVFHSFGGSVADVERIRCYGDFYFGINGIVTFKNSKVGETLPLIGLDRILLETDSPYLAPVPHRGKRNESAYIVNVAQRIAEFLSLPVSTVGDSTTKNAFRLFNLK
ncbi:MAG: TatD family hydrolase [Muribaculum sp.]|nr:TatD family hydrolase [Muribaculum sp.]